MDKTIDTKLADTKLKVGVIGVGGIAGTHFPGWKQSPHTELWALADKVPAALERVGQAQDVALRYEDAQELIDNPEIDIIDICTPNAYHAPLAIAALKAGKHVICEKPLAPTPENIREMIAARDAGGKLLMTAQNVRFSSSARALKAALSGGILGEIYHARAWILRRNLVPLSPGFLQKQHSGGGPCIDIGVHILDLTLWMMGHPKPVSVSGVTQNKLSKQPGVWSSWGGDIPATMDVEEFAAAFVRFENGATLNLEVSWLLHHKASEDTQMWLYGDKAGVQWPTNEIVTSDNQTKQLLNTQIQPWPEGTESHAAECMAFAEAVVSGGPSPVPAEQSLHVTTILDALYRSAETGREVRLDD